MPLIYEEVVAIKISKLVKEGSTQPHIMTSELKSALADLAEEILQQSSPGVIVEVVDLTD